MRNTLLIAALYLAAAGSLVAQDTAATEQTAVVEPPVGTNFIADRRLGRYYPVGCDLLVRVPAADRLYYATETGARQDGYTPSADCGKAVAGAETARPQLQDAPAPSSTVSWADAPPEAPQKTAVNP